MLVRATATVCLFAVAVAVALAFGGCFGGGGDSAPKPEDTPKETAARFLALWEEGAYSDMYELLSTESKRQIERDAFVERYAAIAEETTLERLEARLLASTVEGANPLLFDVVWGTELFGPLRETNSMRLIEEDDGWRVAWDPSLIFKELGGGRLVRLRVEAPSRGTIFDRAGRALAFEGTETVLGVTRSLLRERRGFATTVAGILGVPPESIEAALRSGLPDDAFVPLGIVPLAVTPQGLATLRAIPGVALHENARRVYPYGRAAAHVLGYLTGTTAEELEADASLRAGDRIGRQGIEASFDSELRGRRGASLTIVSAEGDVILTLASIPMTPAEDVHLTIDIDVQVAAEAALGETPGSVIVLDPRDNSVTAMASWPAFDPNALFAGLGAAEFATLQADARAPFLNRATTAVYPPGSTFKVVTAIAGVDALGIDPARRFHCGAVWTGLGAANPKANWRSGDRGELTLAEGLMESCNPVFYDVALELDLANPEMLPLFAALLGFGAMTGIGVLPEAAGTVPSPAWKLENEGEAWFSGDSVNMGIGQGFLQATPLQIANLYSALATGGPLRTPLLVRRHGPAGAPLAELSAAVIRDLAVSPTALAVVREGLELVTQSARGTAYSVFAASGLDAAGKSGTAEDRGLQEHALFVAYAPASAPRAIAIAVLDEGASGSQQAGPIVRDALRAALAAN